MFEVITRRNIPWVELESLHQELVQKVRIEKAPYLLLSEPQATLTQGRSAALSDLLVSEDFLNSRGITIQSVSRGGKWTYHGPGQIVGYPILHLPTWGYDSKSVHPYLRTLRDLVGGVLTGFGLPVEYQDKPYGIYCQNRKLVSFGIHLSQGVTSHGFALYLKDQRPAFHHINPCGVPGHEPTSLEQQGADKSWEQVALALCDALKKGFNSSKKSLI